MSPQIFSGPMFGPEVFYAAAGFTDGWERLTEDLCWPPPFASPSVLRRPFEPKQQVVEFQSSTFMNSPALSSSERCTHSKLFSHLASVHSDGTLPPRRVSSFNEARRLSFTIRAVAQLEPRCPDHKDQVGDRGFAISCDDEDFSGGLDDKEQSRRMKISRANRGIVPWNKGKRHSAETIQKIRERTKLAMQGHKVRVRLKLINLGRRQSKETKLKIGAGVRIGWIGRRKRMKVQGTCFYEWQNLVAEASRKGLFGEKEMEWNSYKILDEQLEKEWLDSIEQRKRMQRSTGRKRVRKSPEQRRKIAEAIAAKWADPDFRERVSSGMAKYHVTDIRSERRPKRWLSGETTSSMQNSLKTKTDSLENASSKGNIEQSTVWVSNKPPYKDPLVNSKLEMIKNIRSQRKAVESEIAEAVERARQLIAQAEKAAKALEFLAARSATAQASLLESRKLIDEAVELIEAVEARDISSIENSTCGSSGGGTGFSGRDKYEKINCPFKDPAQRLIANGRQSPVSGNGADIDLGIFTLQNVLNLESQLTISGLGDMNMSPNGTTRERAQSDQQEISPRPVRTKKKWVRGRLVEVTDGT